MIFVSYAREDREPVNQIIAAISERLWLDVWSDRNIEIGTSFTRSITTALSDSWVVIVIWTQNSVGSDFVLDEAGRGRDAGKLVPVRLENVTPPLGFNVLQTLDLFGTPGGPIATGAGIESLIREVVRRISEHVKLMWSITLDREESRERELAQYFARNRTLCVVCSKFASVAVLPFYWGLGMLGFRPSLEAEGEASGADMIPILEAIGSADLILFALYPPAMSKWFIDACRARAGDRACFVLFGSLTIDRARAEYPSLAGIPDARFFRKPSVGFPLKGVGVVETWDIVKFILEWTR